MELIQDITSYCLEHSAEAEACDLLMEIEKIDVIEDLVSKDTHERVCLYLTRFTVHTHTHTHTHVAFTHVVINVLLSSVMCAQLCEVCSRAGGLHSVEHCSQDVSQV